MFDKLRNSWELVKASGRVLSADKELMIFPILSGLGVMVLTILFAVPMVTADLFDSVLFKEGQVLGFVALFLFYILQYTIIFFANTALVGAALIRLKGGDPTVADGFRIAFSRLGVILGYALIAATVGMLLKLASEKSKGIGKTILSLIGFAWNIATFLVVPVLAAENVGPIEAIKRSVSLLKKTWGEQIAGNFGLGAVFGLLTFGIILVFIPVFVLAAANEMIWLVIVAAVLLVLFLAFSGLVSSTLNGIYTAAVYQYAVNGETGKFFDPQMVKNAFRKE